MKTLKEIINLEMIVTVCVTCLIYVGVYTLLFK